MIRYEDEVRSQTISNFFRVAIPYIFPVYFTYQIYEWMVSPRQALFFLAIRVSILPLIALFWVAFKKEWNGKWYLASIWSISLLSSLHMVFMASVASRPDIYLLGISMIGGVVLLLFPLPVWQNLVTTALIYTPLLCSVILQRHDNTIAFPLVFQSFSMAAVFLATSISLDRMRYKNFRQKNDLFVLATTDALSGLKLRRYFFNRFIQELSLQIRRKEDLFLSVAMIDIDGFKAINDRYGHPAGDRCIRHIGELIQKSIRIYDVACRFGGEEFIILFPSTQLSETAMVCDRIRKTIENSPVIIEKKEISLTISVGVSGIAPPIPQEIRNIHFKDQKDQRLFLVKSMMRVIKEADNSLYDAKKRGKNQVVLGKPADFVSDTAPEETAILKQYLVYFEQQALILDAAVEGKSPEEIDEDMTFYPPEFFFRRCVEGLYRHYRDSEWTEILTLFRIHNVSPKDVKRLFSSIFRLADVISVVEPGLIGVLFVGIKPEALHAIEHRIRSKMSSIPGMEKAEIRISACQLCFEDPDWSFEKHRLLGQADFSHQVEKLFTIIKRHRHAGQNVYFYEPVRPKASPARQA